MVEDVNIVGIDTLPEWATEKTQAEILKQLKAMHKLTTQQSRQVQQSLGKMGTTGKITERDFLKAKKSFTTGLKDAGESAALSAAGFNKLPGPLKKFGADLKKSSTLFKGSFIAIGLLGNAIGMTIKTVQESVGTLRKLSDSGVIFNQSVVSIQAALADTGLTLEKFGEIASKYARVMGTNGLQGLTQFVTRTRQLSQGFSRFGLTTAEATEYAAEYLEQQRLAGVFAQANNRQQSLALRENIARLTAYSKVLNVSRQQLQDMTKQMLDRDDLQAMFFTMAPEERLKAQEAFQTVSQGLASLGAPGAKLLEMFTDLAASPIEENSEAFRQLAAVSPELAQNMVAMSRNVKEGVSVTQDDIIAMAENVSANTALIDALRLAGGEIKTNAELIAGLGMAAQEARVSQAQLAKKAAEAGMSMDDYLRSVDSNVSAATNLDDSLQRLQATAEYTMVKGFAELVGGAAKDAVNAMADGLNYLTEKLRGFADGALTDAMQYIRGFFTDPGESFSNLFDTVVSALGSGLRYIGDMVSAAVTSGLQLVAAKVEELNPFSDAATNRRATDRVADIDQRLAMYEEVLSTGRFSPGQTEQSVRRNIAGLQARRTSQLATISETAPPATITAPSAAPANAASGGTSAAPTVVDMAPVVETLNVTNGLLRRISKGQVTGDVMQ